MNIGGLHQRFKDRLGVSNGYGDLLPYEIDLKLNEAQDWIVTKYGDQSAERSFIKTLLAPFFKTVFVDFLEINNGKEYYFSLPSDIVYVEKITYTCNELPSQISIVPLDQIDKMRTDELQKPSRYFNRSLAVIEESKVRIYTDQILRTGELTYLRQPKHVFFGGYDTTDYLYCVNSGESNCNRYYSQSSDPVSLEFLEAHQNLVIDVAVFLESGKVLNSAITQIIGQKIQN